MKREDNKRFSWRDPLSGALVGLLSTLLLFADVQQSAENSCTRLRYWLAGTMLAHDQEQPIVYQSLLESNVASVPGDPIRNILPLLESICKKQPSAVLLYLDLRRNKIDDETVKQLLAYKHKIVVSYFGVDEVTPNAYDLLRAAGVACAHTELAVEPSGLVCKLPLANRIAADSRVEIPSLCSAVLDCCRRNRQQGNQEQGNQIGPRTAATSTSTPTATATATADRSREFAAGPCWIDFLHRPRVENLALDREVPDGSRGGLAGKVVVISEANAPDRVLPTPASPMSCLAIHLTAISTLMSGHRVLDVSAFFPLALMPIGALFGAYFVVSKPLHRLNVLLLSILGIVVASQVSFFALYIFFPIMPPLLVLLFSYLACSMIFIEVEEVDKARSVAAALESRTEEERRRISREIHDETLPALTRVKRIANGSKEHPEGASDEICEKLDGAISEMRRMVDDLHPLTLESLGFVAAIEALVDRFSEHSTFKITMQSDWREPVALPQSVELSLYRIIQESLNNVEKHAGASMVQVLLSTEGKHLIVSVVDNGKGIAPDAREGGHGLENIRQRATLIGAEVEWRRSRVFSCGTEVRVKLKP